MGIDSGLVVSPLVLLLIFALVLGLGFVIYAFGAAVVGRMHQARREEQTDGSGMQTGDPVNPVLGAEETINPSDHEPDEQKPSPL